jgi:hypothetical protein
MKCSKKLAVGSCALPFEPDVWTDMMRPIVDFSNKSETG